MFKSILTEIFMEINISLMYKFDFLRLYKFNMIFCYIPIKMDFLVILYKQVVCGITQQIWNLERWKLWILTKRLTVKMRG